MTTKNIGFFFEKVREIVNDIDPMELMGGAPIDEYDNEIAQILVQLENVSDEKMLANRIYDIFLKAFGDDIGNQEKYIDLARRSLCP